MREAIPCGRPGKEHPRCRDSGSVFAANPLEDLLVFLAVKAAQ
jgi:hypothetical protein